MKYILIVGAKSDICMALAEVYAKNNNNLYLAGRNITELEDFRRDLNIRYGVDVRLVELDVTDFNSHKRILSSLNPRPEGLVYCAGYMTDQKKCEESWEETLKTINTNYTGAVSITNIFANELEKTGKGFIIGISSVAGERGRMSNYIYGSSKAGFTAYLSGLRARLHKKGVHVMTVKPGFVRTKMTKNLKLPPLLTADPEEVAKAIYRSQQKKVDVLYVRGIWRFIMMIIKLIPERLFKKLSI
ncbi:MAG: SDR family oxidoreductase [Hydrogenothermaceae bacterium]|nr:SDR family oxidoreductase [Hydrogenothermaceae bacterium]